MPTWRRLGWWLWAMALAFSASPVEAQTSSDKVEFTASAINMNTTGAAATSTVQIVIDRWSTDAERDRLLAAFQESGSERQLTALQKLPRIGYIRTPDSIGYELHYARQVADEDGGRKVFIATDRYISFWEAANRPRSIDYPFTLIELHIGHGGTGEGRMSIATRIIADKTNNVLTLENYSALPVRLQNVQERKR